MATKGWTPQEDDLLREQVALHGTNSWTNISANFNDKTSRQCRRRWYTYLNAECKKGGWSVEEDMLLCEAQKMLGNRWTEIAKVVSGRTDNAVKNRFSTLCKKRAKNEAGIDKENNMPCANTDNRALLRERLIAAGIDESSVPNKQMRYDISQNAGSSRQPLTDISQNAESSRQPLFNVSGTQGTFLDEKLKTLVKQADLLSSIATKVNTKSSNESLDEALKQIQEHMDQEDNGALEGEMSDGNFVLDDLKDLIEDLKSSREKHPHMSEASGSKSPLDTLKNAHGDKTMENFTMSNNFIDLTSEEDDPVSINEVVGSGAPIQLREQSSEASGSKPLLDKTAQLNDPESMIAKIMDDFIDFPSKEDPMSINGVVNPGASIQLQEQSSEASGSKSLLDKIAQLNDPETMMAKIMDDLIVLPSEEDGPVLSINEVVSSGAPIQLQEQSSDDPKTMIAKTKGDFIDLTSEEDDPVSINEVVGSGASIQLQEQSSEASGLKSLQDKIAQLNDPESMIYKIMNDSMDFPSKEDPMSINGAVKPGTPIQLQEQSSEASGSKSQLDKIAQLNDPETMIAKTMDNFIDLTSDEDDPVSINEVVSSGASIQLQEQSSEASGLKSLQDKIAQLNDPESMIYKIMNDSMDFPSKEDPMSINGAVNPGTSMKISKKMEMKGGSSSGASKNLADSNFASPVKKFPAFRSLADSIPTPKFSESERKFLQNALGASSPDINSRKNPSCRRVLRDL